jgi:hypothetical protein
MTDTSDYGSLTSCPQQLLATVSGLVFTVTVTLPDSCTGIRIIGGGGSVLTPTVVGVTSSAIYSTVQEQNLSASLDPCTVYVADVSQRIDAQVTITVMVTSGSEWYVLADNGVHSVATFGGADRFTVTGDGPVTVVGGIDSADNPVPLQLDSSGRVLLAPATTSFNTGILALAASMSTLFGPSGVGTVLQSLRVELSALTAATAAAFSVIDSGSGHALWTRQVNAAAQLSAVEIVGPNGYTLAGQLELTSGAGWVGTGSISVTGLY